MSLILKIIVPARPETLFPPNRLDNCVSASSMHMVIYAMTSLGLIIDNPLIFSHPPKIKVYSIDIRRVC